MSEVKRPLALIDLEYERAAQTYLASLPPEHHMEAEAQATQREITVQSFALLRQQRPDVHYFNELLVQYPFGRPRQIRQVVPDNMVVVHSGPIRVTTNFGLEVQPCAPFWMLEYVSKNSVRKDYEDSFKKYERELKVPYYLIFYPDNQELTLYHLVGRRYRAIVPDDNERCALVELELEIGIHDGWARFWYRGDLLQLPTDLFTRLEAVTEDRDAIARDRDRIARERDITARERDAALQRSAEMATELAQLRAQLGLSAK